MISNSVLIIIIVILFIKGDFWEPTKRSINLLFGIKENYSYDMNKLYHIKNDMYLQYNGQADIVMFGDSMMEYAEWCELLDRDDVVNRGISGDITEGMLKRLDNIIKLKPKICLFMGGINDIIKKVPYGVTLENVNLIVEELKKHGIKVIIQSVLYTGRSLDNHKSINMSVGRLNNGLMTLAERSSCLFLDINEELSKAGHLKDEYTYDGIHLNFRGYDIWGKVMKSKINDF
jgi:lysophospholipase L1-like esterase